MNFKPKKTSLLILGIVSVVCSRIVFMLIDDPEGPNLLIVLGLAAVIFAISVAVYALSSSR